MPTAPSCVLSHSACSASPTTVIVLPIELTKFQGQCINNQVTLVWQTASETNNKIFNIERSADGIHFNTIGSVKGAGTSINSKNYSFIDKNAEANAYYRLSQEDYNGGSSKSGIISIKNNCLPKVVSDISIVPNPSQEKTSLNLALFQSSEINVEIHNDIGQLIQKIPAQILDAGIQTISLDNNYLEKGIYFIKVSINGQETIHKLIKL